MSRDSLTLISIETSTELASVALLHEGRLSSRESMGAQTHSSTVPGMIQDLLKEAGVKLSHCDAVAFGAGPGSFTGVRTACGLAQGLAFGANIPVVPVITLLAMAQRARALSGNETSDVLSLLDARMGEVYWAQYRFESRNGEAGSEGHWTVVTEPFLSAAVAVAAEGHPTLCGNGLSAYGGDLLHLQAREQRPEIMPHATDVLTLAVTAVREGQTLPARDAQPLYLRNKVALTTRERQSGVAA